MSDFESQVKEAAEQAVLKFVRDGGWLLPNYESRVKIPASWMNECWQLVDTARLKKLLAQRIEEELSDRMVSIMAAELATDIKQILSHKERREMLRGLARQHMDAVMAAGAEVKR